MKEAPCTILQIFWLNVGHSLILRSYGENIQHQLIKLNKTTQIRDSLRGPTILWHASRGATLKNNCHFITVYYINTKAEVPYISSINRPTWFLGLDFANVLSVSFVRQISRSSFQFSF